MRREFGQDFGINGISGMRLVSGWGFLGGGGFGCGGLGRFRW